MKNIRVIIVVVVCACLCLGYYFYLSNRSSGKEEELTEIQQVLSQNLEKTYPTTPREVVKFYNRILRCLYNESDTKQEQKELGLQARRLMDEELLEENPEEEYLRQLEADVSDRREKDEKLMNITISTSNEVEYKKVKGEECAYVEASYFFKGSESSERAGQIYILRKDQSGKWKILGYYIP